VAELSGMEIANPQGTGLIVNLYGLLIKEQTRGTNSYSIYTEGNSPSSFGGDITLRGLAGNGTRVVVVDSNGKLSTQ
jgi:hypothetical protein